jgi:GH25 family lysozyme M1 (1,4-beta-N-acetylmuramidase)
MTGSIIGRAVLATAIAAGLHASPAISGSADLSQVMVDVSSHNDLTKILPFFADRQIKLVFMRATIGLGTPDTTFDQKLRLLRERSPSSLMGVYHALYPGSSGQAQAQDFLATVKKSCIQNEKILLAVDWERPRLHGNLVETAPAQTLEDFVSEVRRITHGGVLVYTGPDVIAPQSASIGPMTKASPLWLATYYSKVWLSKGCKKQSDTNAGFVCSDSIHGLLFPELSDIVPWSEWKFWQFSAASKDDPAYLQRVTKDMPVDVSFFGGSRDEFEEFFTTNAISCSDITL